jgi:hypothetical protein
MVWSSLTQLLVGFITAQYNTMVALRWLGRIAASLMIIWAVAG